MLRKLATIICTALALAAIGIAPATAAEKKINIGWTAWSDAEAVTKMAKQILEERLDYKVTLTLADIAIQYQGVATGDLDAMLMAWLPQTHKDYYERFQDQVVDLGPIYTGAKLGWVIPDSIPKEELNSIEDLKKPEVAKRLDGKIYGIDPGAGLMRLSQGTMKEYDLDGQYTLVSSSGAGMTSAMERAIRRDEWVVVTSWSPHWMFGKWELRYLEDPKGTLGGEEAVHAIARKDLEKDAPEAYAFLDRMEIPIDELQAVMAEAEESSYEEAVANYIKNNPERVDYWVTGEKKE